MKLLPNRGLMHLLAVGLALFVAYYGILPPFSRVDTDFPNYYSAARIVIEGKDATRLYDDDWFQNQLVEYGFTTKGKFAPFPPATALVMVPLAWLEPLPALQMFTFVNILLMIGSLLMISRCLSLSVEEAWVFLGLSGLALANCLRFGQVYIAVSFAMIAAYYFFKKGHSVLSGIALGLFIPMKYFPLVIVGSFALFRKWRGVVISLCIAALITLTGVLTMGWEIHEQFFTSILPQHLLSDFSQQSPFSFSFQSWDSLLRRLFVFDPLLNPNPAIDNSEILLPAKLTIIVLLISTAFFAIMTIKKHQVTDGIELCIAIFGVLALLIAPGTATYHFVLLWLPVGLLGQHLWTDSRRNLFHLTLGLYAAIGFLPYSLLQRFDGFLTPVAYPRLGLLLGLFVVTVVACVKSSGLGRPELFGK